MTDLNCYIFNTGTGLGTLFGINNPDADLIHVAHSVSKVNADGFLQIDSDDGNESSYGMEIWMIDKQFAACIKNVGRDCFSGTLADSVFGDAQIGIISISEFDAAFKNHLQNWEYRTANSTDDLDRKYKIDTPNLTTYFDGNSDLHILYSDMTETWDFRCDGYAILVDSSDPDRGIGDDLVGQFIGDSGVIARDVFDKAFAKLKS